MSVIIKITLIFNENVLFTFSPVGLYATVSEDFKHKRAAAELLGCWSGGGDSGRHLRRIF